MKLYRATGCYDILKLVDQLRNKVNAVVDKAKGDFIRQKLNQNTKNPKKFWQSIKELIKTDIDVDISNILFRNNQTGDCIEHDDIPNYLND